MLFWALYKVRVIIMTRTANISPALTICQALFYELYFIKTFINLQEQPHKVGTVHMKPILQMSKARHRAVSKVKLLKITSPVAVPRIQLQSLGS